MQDNSETNAATKEQVRQKTPKEIAESVYAECILVSMKIDDTEQRSEKLQAAIESAKAYLDYHVDFWLQTRAEFQSILNITKK
jgi:hypothetical protein